MPTCRSPAHGATLLPVLIWVGGLVAFRGSAPCRRSAIVPRHRVGPRQPAKSSDAIATQKINKSLGAREKIAMLMSASKRSNSDNFAPQLAQLRNRVTPNGVKCAQHASRWRQDQTQATSRNNGVCRATPTWACLTAFVRTKTDRFRSMHQTQTGVSSIAVLCRALLLYTMGLRGGTDLSLRGSHGRLHSTRFFTHRWQYRFSCFVRDLERIDLFGRNKRACASARAGQPNQRRRIGSARLDAARFDPPRYDQRPLHVKSDRPGWERS